MELIQTRLDSVLFQAYKPIMLAIASFFNAALGLHHVSKFDRSGKQAA